MCHRHRLLLSTHDRVGPSKDLHRDANVHRIESEAGVRKGAAGATAAERHSGVYRSRGKYLLITRFTYRRIFHFNSSSPAGWSRIQAYYPLFTHPCPLSHSLICTFSTQLEAPKRLFGFQIQCCQVSWFLCRSLNFSSWDENSPDFCKISWFWEKFVPQPKPGISDNKMRCTNCDRAKREPPQMSS